MGDLTCQRLARQIRLGFGSRRWQAKTPARRGVEPWATSGGRFCEANLRARAERPSYILDFSICRRCQAVGNWGLPGGVMLVTHPPACVDDTINLALRRGRRKRKPLADSVQNLRGNT